MNSTNLHLSVILLCIFTSGVMGQERKFTDAQKEKLELRITETFERINLSNDQKQRLKGMKNQYVSQMKAIRNSDISNDDKVKDLKAMLDKRNQEMKGVLSTEQYQFYKETQNRRRQNFKNLKESFEELDLIDSQKLAFTEITVKFALQMSTLRKSDQRRLVKVKEFTSIIDSKNKEMKNLLSNEQYKVYEIRQSKTQRERLKMVMENN
jgi:hypothetical protein